MYMLLGFGCFGVGFALALSRKHGPAAVVLLLLGGALIFAQLSSQP